MHLFQSDAFVKEEGRSTATGAVELMRRKLRRKPRLESLRQVRLRNPRFPRSEKGMPKMPLLC